MLTTLLKPTSGSLELDGLDRQFIATKSAKRFGVVFQDQPGQDLTAWENREIPACCTECREGTSRTRDRSVAAV
jgi:ABC-type multidrug transport system ATPase subunit